MLKMSTICNKPLSSVPAGWLDTGKDVEGAVELGSLERRVDLHDERKVGAAQSALGEWHVVGLVPVLQRSINKYSHKERRDQSPFEYAIVMGIKEEVVIHSL
jgi:hypothetical protein